MGEILEECVDGLEKCWWEGGEGNPFHPNLKKSYKIKKCRPDDRLSWR